MTTEHADVYSRGEIIDMMEHAAKLHRDISARQIMALYEAGELEQPGDVLDVIGLARLLGADDPYFSD